jgi:site-specific DNA recombinase
MLGTAATGRSKTYRYYTCFTRARYGTQECSASRVNADDTDRAALAAMRDFYAHHTDLIAKAVTDARVFYTAGHAERIGERDTITNELAKANAKVERYFTAFETRRWTRKSPRPVWPKCPRRSSNSGNAATN